MQRADTRKEPRSRGVPRIRPVTYRFLAWTLALFVCAFYPVALWLMPDTHASLWPAIALYWVMALFAALGVEKTYPHERVGICNAITLFRAALIATLILPVFAPEHVLNAPNYAWGVVALAVFTLVLDGFDGFFARREKLISTLGARFDMEIDAVFALLLALVALMTGKAGAWVLVLGGARYGFILASLAWPWLKAALPERFSRKLVCVVQIGVLIGLLAPVITPPISSMAAAIASALLVWSFARDIVWLARHRQ